MTSFNRYATLATASLPSKVARFLFMVIPSQSSIFSAHLLPVFKDPVSFRLVQSAYRITGVYDHVVVHSRFGKVNKLYFLDDASETDRTCSEQRRMTAYRQHFARNREAHDSTPTLLGAGYAHPDSRHLTIV